jgi:hypothetical protein
LSGIEPKGICQRIVPFFDYLLKPFDRARFSKVMADVRRQAEKGQQSELQDNLRRLLEEVQSLRNPRLLVEENGRGILIA